MDHTLDYQKTIEALEAERNKLNFLLDKIGQGIIVTDADLNIVYVNRSAYLSSAFRPAENARLLTDITDDSQIISSVHACILTKTAQTYDLDSAENDGKIYSISVSPVAGEWIANGAILIITDVTHFRQAEQIRREFFANASHELKTPITAIMGFSELLGAGLVDDMSKVYEYVGRIQKQARNMSGIINDILRLSSLEEKRDAPAPVLLNLQQVSVEAAAVLATEAEKKNVTIHVDAKDTYIDAQRDDIWQLILNLLDNAVKYNIEGGRVDLIVYPENDDAVLIVKDTGIGIPAQDLPRVFERFYRVNKGRSRSIGGTGLGLSIVKHIVARYRGELSLQSNLSVGTEFTIRFKRAAAPK
jgi:two-component system phosphate regulon sensor histidine kinase PhoR